MPPFGTVNYATAVFGFEPRIKGVRVVASVPNRSLGLLLYEAGPEGLSEEADLARGDAFAAHTETGGPEPSVDAVSPLPLPRLIFPMALLPFLPHECAVYKALREVQASTFVETFGEGREHPLQRPVAHQPLQAAVTGLVGRAALMQVVPGDTGSEHPVLSTQRMPPRTSLGFRQGIFR